MTEKELALILKDIIEEYKLLENGSRNVLKHVKTYEELDYRYFHSGLEIAFANGEKFLVEMIKYVNNSNK